MKKVYLFAFISLLLINITLGCTNFLAGVDLKRELEEKIEYAANSDGLHIISKSPEFSNTGVNKNSAIYINFDKSLSTSTFQYSIKNSKDEDVTDYYEAPVFTEDNKSVCIKNKIPVDIEEGTENLRFIISKNLTNTEGGRLSSEDYSWEFKINNLTDRDAPEIADFRVYKSRYLMEKGKSFTEKNWRAWSTEDQILNHAGIIHIYCKGYDKDSEITSINITETMVANSRAHTESEREYYESKIDSNYYYSTTNDCFKKLEGSIYSEALITYEFQTEYENGIVELTIDVLDSFNNKATYCYYIAKDTTPLTSYILEATDYYKSNEATPFIYGYSNKYNDSEINSFSNRIYNYLHDFNIQYLYVDRESIMSKQSDSLIKIDWGYEENNYTNSTEFISCGELKSKYSNDDSYYMKNEFPFFELKDIDSTKNIYYKTTVQLPCGREIYAYGIKAAAPQLLDVKYEDYNLVVKTNISPDVSFDENYDCVYKLWYKHADDSEYKKVDILDLSSGIITIKKSDLHNYSCSDNCSLDVDFYIQSVLKYFKSNKDNYNTNQYQYMHGQISQKYTVSKNGSVASAPDLLKYNKVSFESVGSGTGLQKCTMTILENSNDKNWIETITKVGGEKEIYSFDSSGVCTFYIDTDVVYNKVWQFALGNSLNGSSTLNSFGINFTTQCNIKYNVPPKFVLDYYGIDSERQYFTCKVPTTGNSKGMKISGGKVNVKVWYYKLTGYSDPLYSSYGYYNISLASTLKKSKLLTDSDIRSFNLLTVSYTPSTDKYLKIPISDFEDTSSTNPYLFCFEVEDYDGNIACEPCFYFINSVVLSPSYDIRNSLTTVAKASNYSEIDYVVGESLSTASFGFLHSFDTSANKWVEEFSSKYFERRKLPEYSKYRYCLAYQPAYAKSSNLNRFLMFTRKGTNIGTGDGAYSKEAYKIDENGAVLSVKNTQSPYNTLDVPVCNMQETSVYAPVYYYGGFTSDNTCAKKILSYGVNAAFIYYQKQIAAGNAVPLLTGEDEVFIEHDWPVFVQVLTSKINWDEHVDNENTRVASWELHAKKSEKINPKVLGSTLNGKSTLYSCYSIDKSKIPSGNYYVVVTYFADGTSAITDVRKN